MELVKTMDTSIVDGYERRKLQLGKNITWIKWGLGALTLALASTLLVALAKAAVAVWVIAAVGASLALASNFYPVALARVKNKRLQLIMDQARKDPIYTALNIYLDRENKLALNKEQLSASISASNSYATVVQTHAQNFPEDPQLPRMLEEVERDKMYLARLKEKRVEAKAAQDKLKRTIEMMQSQYEAAKARMKASSSITEIETAFENIMLSTSYKAVMEQTAQSFAELEIAQLDDDVVKRHALPLSKSTIEFEFSKSGEVNHAV
jgi:hypothetical protein